MRAPWIIDELMAKIALRDMDAMTDGAELDPVRCEVAKAVTVAQQHPDIEARVVCETTEQAIQSISMLLTFSRMEGQRFDGQRLCLELDNGSGVRVEMRERAKP
jgi:hypothetical protein